MPDKLHIPANVPLVIGIADPDGEYDHETLVGQYQTTDGRVLTLPRSAVVQMNDLDLRPGERIRIVRHTGRSGSSWEVRRAEEETAQDTPAAPRSRVGRPPKGQTPPKRRGRPPKVTDILTAGLVRKKPERRQPQLFDQRGTGTNGPAPVVEMLDRMPEPRVYRTAAEGLAVLRKTPYGEMLRHIIRTVTGALKAENVQMGSDPLEKLISTIYQDAAGRQGVEYDFREDK